MLRLIKSSKVRYNKVKRIKYKQSRKNLKDLQGTSMNRLLKPVIRKIQKMKKMKIKREK